jgi:PPOX class probable F420-dependent enzyme
MDGTRTAKVATARKDGRPHVVPVWFVLDGDDVVFTTGASSVKGQALRREPYACLCVDDQVPPFSFVMVEGPVELSSDLDELRRVATTIGRRYMGEERAEEFGARNAAEGELVVRLRPSHVLAQAELAD